MGVHSFLLAALLIAPPAVDAHGDVHDRIVHLSEHIAEDPRNADLLVKRGRLYLDDGHASEARDDMTSALELAPQHVEALYYLAQAELALGHHEAALHATEHFGAKARNDATRARGWMQRGDILLAARQPLPAAESYEAALAVMPEPGPDEYLKAAEAYHAGGSARALEVIDRAISRLGPLTATALDERALLIEQEAGRYQDALRRVERMLARNRRVPFLLYRKGTLLEALGQHGQAAESFRLALAQIEAIPNSRRNTRAVQDLTLAILDSVGADTGTQEP